MRAVEGTGDELVVVDQLQLDHSRSPEHGRAVLDTRVQDAGDELCVDEPSQGAQLSGLIQQIAGGPS